jgi:uncharacterized membrane protein HdeD (DUF308 family)
MIEGFLLGIISTSSLIAGAFFLRFWRQTRDSLFLTFGIAFIVEGINRSFLLFLKNPSEGSPWIYMVRLFAFLLILGGIVRKNMGRAN